VRVLLLIALALLGLAALACGDNGEPSAAPTPTGELAETPATSPEVTPGATDVNIEAVLPAADDLPEGWQFQGIEECGASTPRGTLCPTSGITTGRVAFAIRGPGENLSVVVVVAEPDQAATVTDVIVARALTGERPWTRETIDSPVPGTERLQQELSDVSPPRMVERIVFNQGSVVVDVSLSLYQDQQDLTAQEIADLVHQRINEQLP